MFYYKTICISRIAALKKAQIAKTTENAQLSPRGEQGELLREPLDFCSKHYEFLLSMSAVKRVAISVWLGLRINWAKLAAVKSSICFSLDQGTAEQFQPLTPIALLKGRALIRLISADSCQKFALYEMRNVRHSCH
jgi:hypothetical protein